MNSIHEITLAKRKRLLKAFGSCPAGYIHDDLERFLDLLYGMFSDVYTMTELRQIVESDLFDRSEQPRQLKLVELREEADSRNVSEAVCRCTLFCHNKTVPLLAVSLPGCH